MGEGLYLFCLARLSRLPALPLKGLGLDGRSPLQVTDFQDLAAVWAPVPLQDFCGPEATERLEDLTWIGPRVIRHQEVVAGVMRYSPVLPARFGTIFLSAANLQKVLRQRYKTIATCLERLSDREEWAVKGLLDRAAAKDRLFCLKLAQKKADLEGLSPGKRYLEEQALRVACDRELPRWLKVVRLDLWEDLGCLAAESRERRLLSREAGGRTRDMVFNWAFLLPAGAVAAFREYIQAANDRYANYGLWLECTGPWPPYSFCPALEPESVA
ncbi:MAG: GvpL/GvpF family gas vesicle protein [Deltaproteobacteria bacterium]|nr:GvpL/GvpF family gas vesicle protein [Deltaproteobacteria bacterium]